MKEIALVEGYTLHKTKKYKRKKREGKRRGKHVNDEWENRGKNENRREWTVLYR